jgi:hypothetical protein
VVVVTVMTDGAMLIARRMLAASRDYVLMARRFWFFFAR